MAGHGHHPLPIAAMEVFAKQQEDQIDIGRDLCVVCGDRASGIWSDRFENSVPASSMQTVCNKNPIFERSSCVIFTHVSFI